MRSATRRGLRAVASSTLMRSGFATPGDDTWETPRREGCGARPAFVMPGVRLSASVGRARRGTTEPADYTLALSSLPARIWNGLDECEYTAGRAREPPTLESVVWSLPGRRRP